VIGSSRKPRPAQHCREVTGKENCCGAIDKRYISRQQQQQQQQQQLDLT